MAMKILAGKKYRKRIGDFVKHISGKNSTMKYGEYYEKEILLPFGHERKRMLRVWLPPQYKTLKNKRFPVIYMADGQNLVDNELAAYGDWHLDKVIHDLEKKGFLAPVLVGLDCPKDPLERVLELNPPYEVDKKDFGVPAPEEVHPYGDRYINYFANVVKKEIDRTFRTNPSVKYTGIGGSSMGGIMAFYAFLKKPKVFGFSLAFSIPFFFYTDEHWIEIVNELGRKNNPKRKLAMFVGGIDSEKDFVPGALAMVQYLRKIGYSENEFIFFRDPSMPHHEDSWSKYCSGAFSFWLENLD